MILQALTRYYEDLLSRGEIAAPGWAPAKISFALCLNENGELTQIVPTMDEVSKGKKTVFQPQLITLPAAVKRTVSIAANFLWDNSAYLLGIDQKGKPERSRECFAAAAKLHHAVLDSVDSPNARAILAFFDTWKPEHAAEHPALIRQLDDVTAGGNLVFRVDGRKVEEDAAIREAWLVAASQPHQMAYRYGVARHAHNLRGVQQHVYVLPFQYRADSLPLAHTVIGGTGKVSTLGRGHDGEPLPTTLLIQRMPYLAVQKHLSVHQADARLSHDTLYHAYGTQVIGRVGIARDVGVLQEQRYVGIVHTAEHNGYFMRQRVSACHQRIGSLVVEHGYQLGSPGREVVHETGHTEVFCLLHVAVAVQIVFAYIAVQAEKAELFLQQFQSLRSRRIARLERVYQRNTPCLRMGRVCTHEAERKNQYVSGNCLYVLHIRKVLFDLYQQRYECFLRIMDYFFCFCNKEYVFLNH